MDGRVIQENRCRWITKKNIKAAILRYVFVLFRPLMENLTDMLLDTIIIKKKGWMTCLCEGCQECFRPTHYLELPAAHKIRKRI